LSVLVFAGSCARPKANTANLVLLSDSVSLGAACIDGTPPAYYIQKGSGSGLYKWQIHHEGGGWCTSVADCYARSQGGLGSSKTYAQTMELGFGYMSNDPNVIAMMYNWNKVYLKYCDGASFSGANSTTTMYNGHPLHFKGYRNLLAYWISLHNDQGLDRASDVVIGGCSAGGLATYLHVDWWASIMPRQAKVVGVPDSGFFLEYNAPSGSPHYATDMAWVFLQQNCTSGVNHRCIAAHIPTDDTYKCFFAEHTAPYIVTPILPLNPIFDSWQIANILGSKDVAKVNAYGQDFLTRFNSNVFSQPKNGGFLDACYHHCNSWGTIQGQTAAQNLMTWFNTATGGRLVDRSSYPCSSCCPKVTGRNLFEP